VDDDALVFLREHPSGTVLVAARRAAGREIRLPLATDVTPLLGPEAQRDGDVVVLPATDGPSFTLAALTGS
jgi:alpha-glucosidase